MKIFYTKKDRELVEALKNENYNLREKIQKEEYKYLTDKCKFERLYNETLKVNKDHQDFIEKEYIKIAKLTEKLRKMYGRNGGLTKQNNKLKNENQKLKDEFEEFKKNKFILREELPEKSKNTQKMKIKSSSRQSKIAKKEKELI